MPAFNAYLYFRTGYWLGRRVARLLYRVRIGYVDSAGLERIDPDATVVCVMNHRSNMDYVLAGFLAADQAALSYAVGEWARIWPLSALIRAMGAYFVRRNSRDELYRRVLERYIAMATEAGVPQAVFPEGGLTRDGRMREPKLGVLDYMLRGFRISGERDLVFVPLGLNYDRVLEDRIAAAGQGGRTGHGDGLWSTLALPAAQRVADAAQRMAPLRLRLRQLRHADLDARVCRARIDFQALSGDERRAAVAALGRELMQAVGRIVPVLPVPLIASVFVAQPQRALSELELKAEVGAPARAPARPPARTSTSRAATSTTPSPSACACCALRHLVRGKATACFARARKNCRFSPTMRTPSRICCVAGRADKRPVD